jgi:antirestriction protein
MDLEEVAEELINECYDLPEFALRYFDYEAFARDLSFDGYTETKYGVILDN